MVTLVPPPNLPVTKEENMTNAEEIEFVFGHPVARICMGLGHSGDWAQITPAQFGLIERRMRQARLHPEDVKRIAGQAKKMVNSSRTLSDEELMLVLRSPVLRMLLSYGGSDRTWRRGINQLQLTPEELDLYRKKNRELCDELRALFYETRH
jgi:cytochrome P450